MSCRVQNGKALLPNGKQSELFKKLVSVTGNPNEATKLYEDIYSKNFKEWYGKDWEKDYAVDPFFTDDNGEPKLVIEKGYSSIKNTKGKTFKIPTEIKEIKSVLDIGRELQEELINTLASFVNRVRQENPNRFKDSKDVEKYFGLDKDTEVKGDLADKILLEAFTGLNDINVAKDLVNTLVSEGQDAFVEALPEGVSMNSIPGSPNNASALFLFSYINWNSETNPVTGNIQKIGVREVLKNSLSAYGLKLKDRAGTMELFDDSPERIYNQSSLEENPRDKLSAEARAILGNIETKQLNSFGYPIILSMDNAYSIMAEATVDQPTWKEMKSSLDWYADYKPESAGALRDKVETLTAKEQATLFHNFKTAYNNFILFKKEQTVNDKGEVNFVTKIINSNRSGLREKSFAKFQRTSREKENIPNDRALYKVDGDNALSIKEGKIEKLQKLWDSINNVRQNKFGVWGE